MITNEPFSQNVNFYPWQDAVEKYRVSNPQAMIDTDFEYSLQGSKWEQVQLINNYPSVFIRSGEPLYTGTQITFVSAASTPSGNQLKEVRVGLAFVPDFPLQVGNPISIKDTASGALFDGQFVISKVYSLTSFAYLSRNRNENLNGNIQTPYTVLYTGGFFTGSQLPLSALAVIPNTNDVRAIFRTPHGMFVGSPIYVIDQSLGGFPGLPFSYITGRSPIAEPSFPAGSTPWCINNGNLPSIHSDGRQLSALSGVHIGSFLVKNIVSDTELTFTTLSTFSNVATRLETLSTQIRARNEGYAVHRWADGGVSITPGTSVPNAQMIRQTRKYFRYQSGKGLQFSTGVVFRPTYEVTRTQVSFDRYNPLTNPNVEWTIFTDNDNGFVNSDPYRIGPTIRTTGFQVSGGFNPYNSTFIVSAGSPDLRSFVVNVPYDNSIIDVSPGGIGKIEVQFWRDATVRTGLFDDQNGLFFEYDGEKLYVVRRNATQQLAGFVAVSANSSAVFGSNTKFRTQLKETDYIVLKGMPYVVTKIISDTQLFVAPDYRGVDVPELNVNVKPTKVEELRIPQDQFNVDRLDGTGPSGYVFDPQKMQMVFIDYSWYGAGKIRFGMRGTNGNIIYFHEIPNNNVNTEAYMRTGNLPGRFEIQTKSKAGLLPLGLTTTATKLSVLSTDSSFLPPSGRLIINNEYVRYVKTGVTGSGLIELDLPLRNEYGLTELVPASASDSFITFNQNFAPNLSHWGVSVMMDGRFDEDKSYLFTAATSGNINLGSSVSLGGITNRNAVGSPDWRTNQGQFVPVPLLSIRLAPSVDYGQTGDLGVRNLINRSSLTLKSVGIQANTQCQIILRLNSDNPLFALSGTPRAQVASPGGFNNGTAWGVNSLSEVAWQRVGNGSLAQYIDWSQQYNQFFRMSAFGGDIVNAFFADGPENVGGSRFSVSRGDIDVIRELSNSIVGGRNCYPDGPDILTIFAVPINFPIGGAGALQTSEGTPPIARCRVSWTESQG